ncbi:hypothetical protein ACOSP7_022373 [Xanthoceras sorbifolium]|uniref:Uncharacterized protein n=1 Tax=Xanthoceras sorbifolium TaxID=99658 RepID=A0ABQ8HP28_9ROSI|nr:hypothetical protein JRO89_XS08G0087000 [Xanthoceras sorbifolium]
MLDHRQPIADPACRVNSNYGSAGDSEFDFWGGKNLYYQQLRDELQCQADTEGFGALSKSRNSTEYEFSPLLPHNYHQNSNLSPRMRSDAIAEGRRELMEMIQNMPECNYELSLKDIVDGEKTSQGVRVKEEMVIDKTSLSFKTEDQIKKQKKKTKKKIVESGGISRTASMDNEIFLIKMFFPWSLGSKKKSTSKNCSRVSPRTSFERCDNQQWMERENEATGKNCRNSNTSRKVEVNSTHGAGCWPIFHTKKSKNKNREQRGCIF